MIERLEDVPAGTVGLRASGEVTRDDYDAVLEPALRAAAEAGEVRLLFVLGPDFDGYAAGALVEDAKMGASLGIGHHAAWRRTAIVTDVEWMRHALGLLGWMAPGEVRVFGLEQEREARDWVAG